MSDGLHVKILDYTYTSEPSINTAIPLHRSTPRTLAFALLCLLTLGFGWLVTRWSARRKASLMYQPCSIEGATHWLIVEEGGGASIVSREDRQDVLRNETVAGFRYHDRQFLYHVEKEVFLPIRYQELGLQLDRLKRNRFHPHSARTRLRLLRYFGANEIKLQVQSIAQVFIEEMLTPYEVFQTYAIMLWIYEEYYIFSVLLLGYSLYTYWDNSREVVENQKKLATSSDFSTECQVVARASPREKERSQTGDQLEEDNNSEEYSIAEEIHSLGDQQQHEKRQLNLQLSEEVPYQPAHTHSYPKLEPAQPYKLQPLHSRDILPGDIIVLSEGGLVPCDCIIISGEALVDESYINGENYLQRKTELENYEYSKDKEKGFLLYLGTKVIKVKRSHIGPSKRASEESIENSRGSIQDLLGEKEIACLVTQTNYNTQRGKYLRAVRYQKKTTDNFTRESIYFIYIILVLTVAAFLALLPLLKEGQSQKDMFVMFLDLLGTSIPITLPTALSVGISFAQHRLAKSGVHAIMPANIISGGRADTIVMDCAKVFGKNYKVSSIVVGVKPNGTIGNVYANMGEYLQLSCNASMNLSVNSTVETKARNDEAGKMLVWALATCHCLEKHNGELVGLEEDKNLFEFSGARDLEDDVYSCLGEKLSIKERIYFREKEKKLAVVVSLQSQTKKAQSINLVLDQSQQMGQEIQQHLSQQGHVIFIRGPAQKIIELCLQGTYPVNYSQYVVDMAEKGFKTLAYAYRRVGAEFHATNETRLAKGSFMFCGFALLEAEKKEDRIATLQELKQADMHLILISEETELEASSVAISNKLSAKNSLILCSLSHGVIKCTGHLEWQSSGTGEDLGEFLLQAETLARNSDLSLNSALYEQLFMKRDEPSNDFVFSKARIFNQMENRHVRNLYMQLEKRDRVAFAVGSGSNVSECAHLSIQLQRGQCSMLSSFHTSAKSIKCITECLIICRAALATNFHCFSMMILFALVQFTTVATLYYRYQNLTDWQFLYEDLFVTFPIFITLNMTSPVDKLSKQLPQQSFFSCRALTSMIGQFTIQFITQVLFIMYLLELEIFRHVVDSAHVVYVQEAEFSATTLTLAMFVLTNYLYLGIVLSTSVSKPFRKPFYTNPFYTLTLLLIWLYNTAIVLLPEAVPSSLRPADIGQEAEQVLVMAMLLGNLIMVVMYLYENLLIWLIDRCTRVRPRATLGVDLYMK